MPNKVSYNYDQLIDGVNSIGRQVYQSSWRPDYVAGVLRGGMVPAVHLSHWLNVPLITVEWSLRDFECSIIPDRLINCLQDHKQVLLVDDICDSGSTFSQIVDCLDQHANTNLLRTACLHYNISQTEFEADFYHIELNKEEDDSWIVYPWEG